MKWYEKWLQKLKRASGRHGYTCDSCGAEIFDYPAHRLCAACETHIEENAGLVCEKCGRKTVTEGVCLTCKSQMPLFDKGISPLVYRADTALLINRIKNGDRRLALYFGERMAETLIKELPALTARYGEDWLFIPVPLTKEKLRMRGYNQAQELAEVVMDCLQANGVQASISTDVLEKMRDSRQQKHLSSAKRKENAEGAYHLHKRKLCAGKGIILIDDIMTTGATGSACARLFKNAGAKCVVLLTIAALPERRVL